MRFLFLTCIILPLSWAVSTPAQDDTHRIPIPARPMLFTLADPDSPGDLSGITVGNDESPITEGQNLTVRLWWRRSTPIPDGTEVRLRADGSGPVCEMTYPLDPVAWSAGTPYVTDHVLPFKRLHCNGDVVFSAHLIMKGEPAPAPLYTLPLHIAPALLKSQMDPKLIQKAFGPDALRCGARFRLGHNAKMEVAPPQAVPVRAIGVASFWGYSGPMPLGTIMAHIEVAPADGGSPVRLHLVNGESTAMGDITQYDRLTAPRGGVDVINETKTDKGEIRRIYSGVLDLPRPMAVKRLEFHYVPQNGSLVVEEAALIP